MATITALNNVDFSSDKLDYDTSQLLTPSEFRYREDGGLFDVSLYSGSNDLTYSASFPNAGTITGMIMSEIASTNSMVTVTGLNLNANVFSSSFTGDEFYTILFSGADIFDGQSEIVTFYGDYNNVTSGAIGGGNDTMSDGASATSGVLFGDTRNVSGPSTVFTGGNDTLNMRSDSSIAYGDANDVIEGLLIGGNDSFVAASTMSYGEAIGDVRFLNNDARVIGGDDNFDFRAALGTSTHVIQGDVQIVGGRGILIGGNDIIQGTQNVGLQETLVGDARFNSGSVHGGDDTITGGVNFNNITGDVEYNYVGGVVSGGDDTLTGGGSDDNIYGDIFDNNAGAILTGGDDTLNGGAGNDKLYGDYRTNNGVVVRGGNDTLNGNAGHDQLFGNEGDDILNGGADNDMLNGGAGADIMNGGTGNDNYVVDNGGDIVSESDGEGTDTVNSSISYTLGNHVENLILTADGAGHGNTLANNVSATGSFYNSLYGHAGGDTLELGNSGGYADGGAGIDVLLGGDDGDRLYGGTQGDMLYGYDGNDNVFGEAGDDTLYGGLMDDYLDGGGGIDILYGEENDDRLFGGDDDDTLHGGVGNDRLNGEAGADILHGDAGEDLLDGGAGIDVLNGGDDDDRIYGGTEGDTLHGDGANDRLYGEAGNDTLYGDAGVDILEGGAGIDGLHGGLGTDRLYGDAGNDQLNGGEGADWLFGMADDDTLKGDAGDDVIDGGLGADSLYGGTGDDRLYGEAGIDSFFFADSWGIDKVYGYEAGESLNFTVVTGLTDISQLNITTVGLDIQMSFGGDLLILDGAAGVFNSGDVVV